VVLEARLGASPIEAVGIHGETQRPKAWLKGGERDGLQARDDAAQELDVALCGTGRCRFHHNLRRKRSGWRQRTLDGRGRSGSWAEICRVRQDVPVVFHAVGDVPPVTEQIHLWSPHSHDRWECRFMGRRRAIVPEKLCVAVAGLRRIGRLTV